MRREYIVRTQRNQSPEDTNFPKNIKTAVFLTCFKETDVNRINCSALEYRKLDSPEHLINTIH